MHRPVNEPCQLMHSFLPRPESLGIVCGAFYLTTVFIYIPFNFLKIDFDHLNLIGKFRLVYPILKSAEFEQNEVMRPPASFSATSSPEPGIHLRSKLLFKLPSSLLI